MSEVANVVVAEESANYLPADSFLPDLIQVAYLSGGHVQLPNPSNVFLCFSLLITARCTGPSMVSVTSV